MNTQLVERRSASTTTGQQRFVSSHPPSPLERVALRVGVALIIWSRRTHVYREDVARRHRLHAERVLRERAAEQRWLLEVGRR